VEPSVQFVQSKQLVAGLLTESNPHQARLLSTYADDSSRSIGAEGT